jgi:hypothetical protein
MHDFAPSLSRVSVRNHFHSADTLPNSFIEISSQDTRWTANCGRVWKESLYNGIIVLRVRLPNASSYKSWHLFISLRRLPQRRPHLHAGLLSTTFVTVPEGAWQGGLAAACTIVVLMQVSVRCDAP